MMVSYDVNAIINHGTTRSGLPSAPLDMEYDKSITEQYP